MNTENENSVVITKETNKKKIFLGIGLAVVFIIAVIVLAGIIGTGQGNRRLQHQLDLGNKYLAELDYERAIAAFEAVLEIDPKNVDAYLGLADAYVGQGQYEKAREILRKGYDETGDERIKERLDELEKNPDEPEKLEESEKSDSQAGKPSEASENGDGDQQDSGLNAGNEYLESLEYDKALDEFHRELSQNPQSADAYLGIVEAYIRTNQFDLALGTAKEGYEVTGDERLKEKIDMIERGDIFAANGWQMKESGYDGDGNLIYWFEYTYDLKGRKASVTSYNPQGIQEQYLELAYDIEGRIVIGYHYTSRGVISKVLYEYDENGVRRKSIVYEGLSDEIKTYSELEWNEENLLKKETEYNAGGGVKRIIIHEYNAESQKIKSSYYDEQGSLTSYDLFTYNEDGKQLEQFHYDSSGKLKSRYENIYDDTGKLISSRSYDGEGQLTRERKYS